MTNALREVQKRLPLLPNRSNASPALGVLSSQVAEAYYRCAVEVAKVVYTALDRKFPASERSKSAYKNAWDDAQRIRNDSRNAVLKDVLPMFAIGLRKPDEPQSEGDKAANDFIVQNVFNHMVRTFKAYADVFTDKENVESLEILLDKVAEVQRIRLEGWLCNYSFTAKVDSLETDQNRK